MRLLLPLAVLLASCGGEPHRAPPKKPEDERPVAVRPTPIREEEPRPESASGSASGADISPDWTDRTLVRLAKLQSDDGSWDGSLRTTGFALLAFFSCGETHRHGKYRKTIRTGLDWLKSRQDDDGRFGTGVEHAVATWAMVEGYALTQSPLYKQRAQAAVDALVRDLEADADSTDEWTGWATLVLRSARGSLEVTEATWDLVRRRAPDVCDPAVRAFMWHAVREREPAAADVRAVRATGPIFEQPLYSHLATLVITYADGSRKPWWDGYHRDVEPRLETMAVASAEDVERVSLWVATDMIGAWSSCYRGIWYRRE